MSTLTLNFVMSAEGRQQAFIKTGTMPPLTNTAEYDMTQGDALITITEAAALAGVSVQAISQRIDRGTLTAYINPLANKRQGKRLVRRSDVEK